MNNQESMRIRRAHIQGGERSFSVKFLWGIARREIRCARMVTPKKCMVALRMRIPTLGNIVASRRSMVVPAPWRGTDTGKAKLERRPSPTLTFYESLVSACKMQGVRPPSHTGRVCEPLRWSNIPKRPGHYDRVVLTGCDLWA